MGDLSEEKIFNVPKLTRKNYNSWKARIKSEMLLRECWESVTGYEDAAGATLSQAEVRRRAKENLTALALIMRSVSDELINDIADKENAKEAWETLDKICNENSIYGVTMKLRELTSVVKDETLSVQEYCNKIININRLLMKNDLGFSDKQLAAICLSGLPKEKYEITVKTLTANPENMEFAIVKQYLLEEEEQQTRDDGESHQALKTHNRYQNKQPRKPCFEDRRSNRAFGEKKQNSNNVKHRYWCFACGEEGHFANKCPKRKEHEDPKKASSSVVTREHVSLCARRNDSKNCGVWLLDCGASDHMTYRRDLITQYKEMTGEVQMGDGTPLKVHGKGRVTIKMSDDCGGKDVELRDVLFVPELKDNLISMGQIEEKGVRLEVLNGLCKVFKGGQFIFQAHRLFRMYYITTLDSMSIEDIRRGHEYEKKKVSKVTLETWHSRLGHPNVHVIKEMGELSDVVFRDHIFPLKSKSQDNVTGNS